MEPKTNKALQLFLNAATGFLGLVIIILAIGTVSMYRSSSSASSYTDTIEVQGIGSVQAVPDVARITFGHREENKDLKVAQANLEAKISQAISSLTSSGIEEKDIKQQNYNAYPRYEYNPNCKGIYCIEGNRELVAYEVSQSIQVTVRDIDKAGEILAILSQSGATELSGPYFEIEDPSVYQQDARTLAIEDAKEEAKVVAKSLGVRLGRMVDFYENSYGYPMPYARSSMAGADMVMEEAVIKEISVPVGEDEIEVQVTLVFKIR